MRAAEPTPTFDVVVVGCGPVGAVAAHLFGRAGLHTLVVDKAEDLNPMPRAVHLDHEMMRIFQGLGLVEALEPLMRAAHGHVHIGADGGVIRYLGAHGRPRRFGWANDYFFYQPEIEAELRASLARYLNVELRLGCELTALVQDAEGVEIELACAGANAQRARTRYLVACDGARSAVRRALGVALEDLDFEEPWLVVDAEVEGPIIFPAFAGLPAEADLQHLSVMLCDPRRPATIVPGRGTHRRWEFMLLPGEDDRAMTASERVAELIAPWVEGRRHRIVRATTYRFHGLVADRWRIGRVLLAGDAAHQTPPFYGQGMCHGLRDVANLAWKLKLVLGGEADARLLDTYQRERDAHVRAVIGAAVAAGRYICLLDPAAAAERDTRLRKAATGPPATAADLIPAIAEGVVANCGERFIQPRMSTASNGALLDDLTGDGFRLFSFHRDWLDGLDAGRRGLLARIGARAFHVARAGSDARADLRDETGVLAEWLDAKRSEAVLLRPDSYVYGVASTPADLHALIDRLATDLALVEPETFAFGRGVSELAGLQGNETPDAGRKMGVVR